ncbi:RagB/SusD family nutrient uptake outer membrane protein [Pararcticibacter amylolyticus]|uniref:RagB/SusD family nutrient uptake outer membrane protein n=1 Tax=Pararcticibacter amylolyticus TaxID=2173175 RepID=A0A2U2PCT0_9SPHI|nr:RagB/SusD family nutrient uptake outer membrane protein [Pararcticibacter amylolyticus]PWG79114.1 RagB/SusD family nutrient uptake outer membrane protein [Pararcticibacter amylolyticus]
MRNLKYTIIAGILFTAGITSCNKVLDVEPVSNVGVDNFYRNAKEVQTALTGCYNGLHDPLVTEWMLTEQRTDNSRQNSPTSTAVQRVELNALDMYTQSSQHQQIYNYWLSVYRNIRSINYVLQNLGVTYENGRIIFGTGNAQVTEEEKADLAGQALFLRAYHYFNLVRLFGDVFLITEPVIPQEAKQVGRSPVADVYKLIIADLTAAGEHLSSAAYSSIASGNLGEANAWAAKALLAKVYLTLQQPSNALPLLNDVISNSGYGLESSYGRVFSIDNEMNKEILFAVRFKAGGLGIGNFMANTFAPNSSGNAVVNGDGLGFNTPTDNLTAAYKTPASGGSDQRKAVNISSYSGRPYIKKFISAVQVENDAENDFPVIRFADVLLMKAEALGFDGPAGQSVGLINQVRSRAGAIDYDGGDFASTFYKYPADGGSSIQTQEAFLNALLNERRIELAFENQRFFDLVRTGQLLTVIGAYFESEYQVHYRRYRPVITLDALKANLTAERILLPIPQREIDTNDQQRIPQNSGY